MGKIKTITFERGANLGDYEGIKVTISSEVSGDEEFKSEFLKLKNLADKALEVIVKENAKIKRGPKGERLV